MSAHKLLFKNKEVPIICEVNNEEMRLIKNRIFFKK